MIWQGGETIIGNQDLLCLRLQIVSGNLVAKKATGDPMDLLLPRKRLLCFDLTNLQNMPLRVS
jgi:hypothetical protein